MNEHTGSFEHDDTVADRGMMLAWSIPEIAKALKIDEKDVKEYFTDGRRVSFLLERRIAKRLDWVLAPSEGAGYDLVDPKGRRWEVRSITKGGIYFGPSYDVGSGRSYTERGFREKIGQLAGYVLCDIESFPRIPFWIISVKQVLRWKDGGLLGTQARASRRKMLELLKSNE
ncbi:MAG: hypothetical protein ABIL25_07665 [candidate division WOR-3 bacterium]